MISHVHKSFSSITVVRIMKFFLVILCVTFLVCSAYNMLPSFSVSLDETEKLVHTMRKLDVNRAQRGQVTLNYQGHTSSRSQQDDAAEKLFSHVDQNLLKKETYKKLLALFDNYNRQTGQVEDNTVQEQNEQKDFLAAVSKTEVMKTLYSFLHSKGHPYANSEKKFQIYLNQLWFGRYSRARGVADTSGFEHVFVGEVKRGEISGMHNWVRFHHLEQDAKSHLDYKGFLVKRFNVVAAVKYSWEKEMKRAGSFMIGTSPEFDLAVYTLCFLTGKNECSFDLDGCPVRIISHVMSQQGKLFIGSVYPQAGSFTNECRKNGYKNG